MQRTMSRVVQAGEGGGRFENITADAAVQQVEGHLRVLVQDLELCMALSPTAGVTPSSTIWSPMLSRQSGVATIIGWLQEEPSAENVREMTRCLPAPISYGTNPPAGDGRFVLMYAV